MSRILAGPFNRVEGDLQVTLDIQSDQVASAQVNSPLFRGFERIMLGHDPMDALVYTPRICGICSVSQSVACARALGDMMELDIPENGLHATNLVLANENMTDLLTHFYLFFMPDFARDHYQSEDWFAPVQSRFKATQGSATRAMLPARADFLHLMGIMAGKWPHTLSLQPGGTTKPIEASERVRLLAILGGFRRFLETELFGDNLDVIASLASVSDLTAWQAEKDWNSSDFRRFLHISDSLALTELGEGTQQFVSYGAYLQPNGKVFNDGVFVQGQRAQLDTSLITEDHSHAWMNAPLARLHPREGVTEPIADESAGYSWCKAPRLDGQVVEVGSLARQFINQHPLALDLVATAGANVHSRIVARLLELALIIPKMQAWAKAIDPAAPFCAHGQLPDQGRGVGLIEAARGSLGHWLEVDKGKIKNYQIVAPTTWNFSPRDEQNQPGVLEQALVGAPVKEGEKTPLSVQHIVRSFDPCMACTVH
ncbi:MAG: nickel-dependent hydrogenase large subunit [Pontibacterium sp.]